MARRASDPVVELTKQQQDLEAWGKGVDPERRVDILAAYAVQMQLSVIEAELFEIEEQSRATGAPLPTSVTARLAELQKGMPALRESAHQLGISSIARQYDRVAATLQRLTSH